MKNSIYILLVVLIYSESNLDNSKWYDIDPMPNYSIEKEININNTKDILKSVIVPGWGQYSSKNYKKAIAFLGIEIIAGGLYYHYNSKGIDDYDWCKEFGDMHWSFLKWIEDYNKFKEHEYTYLFINNTSGDYKEIWGGGHTIKFSYTSSDGTSSSHSTGANFETFYGSICGNEDEEGSYDCSVEGIRVIKDHHYYENIGKYDHFFAGWDDNDEIYEHEKETWDELIAYSPNKRKYRVQWVSSEDYNRAADYALYAIYTNHFISLLDMLIFSRINKNSKFNYKLNTIYNPYNTLGIGGIQISIAW